MSQVADKQQNENRRVGEGRQDASTEKALLKFLEIYPGKSADLPSIRPIWTRLMEAGVHPSDLNYAALKYTNAVFQQKEGKRYLKLPQNFLSQGSWLQYIPLALKECPKCGGRRYIECEDSEGRPLMAECSCVQRYAALRMGVGL